LVLDQEIFRGQQKNSCCSLTPFVGRKTSTPPNLSSLVIACAVKRVTKKNAINAGKFVGGQFLF
jgi:hypothetical protein